MTRTNQRLLLLAIIFGAGCSPEGTRFGESERPVAPAGYSSHFVSTNLPTSMFPGERLNTVLTFTNNGTQPWIAGQVALVSYTNSFNTVFLSGPTIMPGQSYTFAFVLNAPPANPSYDIQAVMYFYDPANVNNGQFGDTANFPNINVNSGVTPRWRCGFVSMSPTTMTTGQQTPVTITIRNTGSGTWPSNLCLYDTGNPQNTFGNDGCPAITAGIAPMTNTTLNFTVQPPGQPGSYTFARQVLDNNPPNAMFGVYGLFSYATNCVNQTITVLGGIIDNATFVSSTFPTPTIHTNETVQVQVVMTNSGNETWTNDGTFALESTNNPIGLWGGQVNNVVPVNTPAGQNATFTFNITAPSTPGNQTYSYRMFKWSGPNQGYFGDQINIPVQVVNMGSSQYDATVSMQSIPNPIDPTNAATTFSVTMMNSGSQPWTANGGFILQEVAGGTPNTPANTWQVSGGGNTVALNQLVNPGSSFTFTYTVFVPPEGTYSSNWQMSQPNGVGLFGAVANTNNILVTACGNHIVQSQFGETCDDGNLVSGDGCSGASAGTSPSTWCQIESRIVNLSAGGTADRTFVGSTSRGQLGNVGFGDVNGDGIPDMITADFGNPNFSNGGTIHGWMGGPGTTCGASSSSPFSGATTQLSSNLDTGEGFIIRGRFALAETGAGFNNSLMVGDVTGDGIADIIVSSYIDPGPGGTRSNAGTVYVIAGSCALGTAGIIDLNAMVLPPQVAYVISGGAGDNLRAIGIGDINRDGVADIITGAPFASPSSGTNAGRVDVVRGGLGGQSSIDLTVADPRILATINGAQAGDRLGITTAAVGDVNGDGINDLAVGSSYAAPGGRTNAGALWVLFGQVGGTIQLSETAAPSPGALFLGGSANDALSQSVGIGNFLGSSTAELFVVIRGRLINPTTRVGEIDVYTGPVAAGVHDYSVGLPSGIGTRVLARAPFDLFGNAMAIGDMNRDGYVDIAASSPNGQGPANNTPHQGEVTVILGGLSPPATIDQSQMSFAPALRIYSAAGGDYMGINPFEIAIGDWNGDGRPDLAASTSFGGGGNGAVYLFRTTW